MAGGRQVLPTFHSKMWIACCDGVWKAIKIHNTTHEARWPMLLTRLGLPPGVSFDDLVWAVRSRQGVLDRLETAILFLDEWKKQYSGQRPGK